MREFGNFDEWYRQVERQVRFRPDRRAIRRELSDHYWDHVRDLQRVGYEPELSYRRGLRAMGDPEEVGRALDRVHSPALGWLWMASRVLAVLAVVLTLWNGFAGYFGGWDTIWDELRLPAEAADREMAGPGFFGEESPLWESQWQRTALLKGSGAWENGDYTVSVPYAALWREERQDGEIYHWLSLTLKAEKRRFWDGELSMEPLYLTDSHGRQYHRGYQWTPGTPSYSVDYEESLFSRTYRIDAALQGEGTDWVELDSSLNEDFHLRLEFREVTP